MITRILRNIVIWRLFILVVSFVAIQLIPFKYSFPYTERLLEPQGHPLFWSLANFDGVHYLGIADNGYFAQFTQAFFPLYPLLIKLNSYLIQNHIVSGYLISISSLIAFTYLLHKLITLDYSHKIATKTLFYYLIFPTSFFFAAVYTESIFMLFVIGSLYSARKKRWLLAGLLGGLASATRLFGILLLPTLIIELWLQNKKKSLPTLIKTGWTSIASISLSASGLLLYMRYLSINFSDAFYFLNAQPAFGAQRTAEKLILLYQVFWRYLKMLFTVDVKSLLYFTVAQEVTVSLVFLALSIIAFKKTRLSYAIFGLLAYIMPTLTGTFSSMPRYVLVIFPAFIVLAQIKQPWLKKIIIAFSVLLLVINISLFTRGYWVA